jgi:hypothetical protein
VSIAVTNRTPAPGATGVALNAVVQFDFTETTGDPADLLVNLGDYLTVEETPVHTGGGNFTTAGAVPYRAGTLAVWLNGVRVVATELVPASGTFSLPAAPQGGDVLIIDYEFVAYIAAAIDLNSVAVSFNGALVFNAGAFLPGFGGDIEPLAGGYRFIIDTHPLFPAGAATVVAVSGISLTGPPPFPLPPTAWNFFTALAALTLTPATVDAAGGAVLTMTGPLLDMPATVTLVRGADERPCYSGTSGQGFRPLPRAVGKLLAVTPPLPIGGAAWDVYVRQGASTVIIPAALSVVAQSWHGKTFSLRRVFPSWYKMGPRNLDSVDLLT